jgi:hypothetical protein
MSGKTERILMYPYLPNVAIEILPVCTDISFDVVLKVILTTGCKTMVTSPTHDWVLK